MKVFNLDGSLGERVPPEEPQIIERQLKKVQAVRQQYFNEIQLLSKMIGYSEDKVVNIESGIEIKQPQKRTYNKRSPDEIRRFICCWETSNKPKDMIATDFGFSSKAIAQTFYNRHK